jgi:pimeloyl-ACP methyl ester carboxylesterase
MSTVITEHVCKTSRHTTFYLAAGPEDGPLLIFVHGWPELSICWKSQLGCFAALGFRAVAPDMRGYGRSTVPARHEDYTMEEIAQDMVELLAHLGRESAIWIGHDWGAPVVWTLASHHASSCLGVASLGVPYLPDGFTPENLLPLVDRSIYPEETYPAGQWDYQLYYEEHSALAQRTFEADVRRTLKAVMRSGSPAGRDRPTATAALRREGGWFGGAGIAPDVPRDAAILSEEELCQYASALTANGFFGPDAWYMNARRNMEFAKKAPHGGRLSLPVLFLHGAYDWLCDTQSSRLADPMRAACEHLTEGVVASGHWMPQEKPEAVSAHLARWIAVHVPGSWPAG